MFWLTVKTEDHAQLARVGSLDVKSTRVGKNDVSKTLTLSHVIS